MYFKEVFKRVPQKSPAQHVVFISVWLDLLVGTLLFLIFIYFTLFVEYGMFISYNFFILASLIFVDAFLLLKLSRPIAKKSLLTYFSITRAICVLVPLYFYYHYVTYTSAIKGDEYFNLPLAVTFIILMLVFGAFIYYEVKGRWQLLVLIMAVLGSLIGIAILKSSLNDGNKSGIKQTVTNKRQDNQIGRDFQLLSQDVDRYRLTHGRFPAKLSDAVGITGYYQPQELNDIKSRLGQYDYRTNPLDETFELCATFSTDTTSEKRRSGVTSGFWHKAGYQCILFDF